MKSDLIIMGVFFVNIGAGDNSLADPFVLM